MFLKSCRTAGGVILKHQLFFCYDTRVVYRSEQESFFFFFYFSERKKRMITELKEKESDEKINEQVNIKYKPHNEEDGAAEADEHRQHGEDVGGQLRDEEQHSRHFGAKVSLSLAGDDKKSTSERRQRRAPVTRSSSFTAACRG